MVIIDTDLINSKETLEFLIRETKLQIFTRADDELTKKTLAIYLNEIRKEKWLVIRFSVIIPFSHFLYLVLQPLLISLILQSLFTNPSDINTPLALVGAMIVVSIVTIACNQYGFERLFNHEERATTALTELAMRKLLAHSHGFFADRKVGSIAGDVNTFTRSYMSVMDGVFLSASSVIVNFVSSLIIIAIISPVLLLPLTGLTAMVVYQSLSSIKQRATYRNQRKSLQSKLFGTIADILSNQALVRIFSRQDDEVSRTLKERRRIEQVASKEIDILQRLSSVRQITVFSFQIAIILLSIFLFNSSAIGVAAMVFTVTYLGRITGSMFNITAIIRQFEQAFLDAAKITEIIDKVPDINDSTSAKDITVEQGSVELKNVVFSYPENKTRLEKIFDGLTLSIPAGQRVGLVGHSGGGKTTLGNLLLRYVDIDSGSIYIDGQNIAHVTQSSLRRSIGFVPQDPFLFHRSLRDNIAYGKPDATDEQIIEAAREAHAMEFIERLPDGLGTVVGERGIKLSGGQRQRIAIARAILKDAPILVLDEATSALDSESEKLIQEALTKLMRSRTSIVIAHRLSTISKLDRIIVLDNGQIVEDGPHDELIAKRGLYAKLWAHQTGGFIDDKM